MALTDYVIIPGEDYQAICDVVREKRNETEVIKSGEIAGKIQGIETDPELQNKTIIPTTEQQIVTADEGYDGLGTVTVEAADVVDEIARFIGEARVYCAHNAVNYTHTTINSMGQTITSSKSTLPSCDNMFAHCYNLTTVPLFDTSNTTSMAYMFDHCYNLTTVPLFDTSKVCNMGFMFAHCYNLTTVPLFDTSNVTNMDSMFRDSYITMVPLFDTSNVGVMSSMFSNAKHLTTVPLFDTSKVYFMSQMFHETHNLVTIPALDMRNVSSTTNICNNAYHITNCYLRNIKANLQVGSGTTYGHLLTLDSLIHLIKECRDTGSQKTLTIGSANLEKIANVYVKLIDITDEMRAEDDLIDEKYPFEVCESTDEGAMLITDYAAEKNWAIA